MDGVLELTAELGTSAACKAMNVWRGAPKRQGGMRSINRVPCAIGAGVIGTAKVRWRTAAQRPGNARRQGKSAS